MTEIVLTGTLSLSSINQSINWPCVFLFYISNKFAVLG